MFAKTFGCTIFGLDGIIVSVEVDISNGIPALDIVGLADTAVKESRERVKAAIRNAGFEFPGRRITINLAPANVKKNNPGLDLAMAVGILTASGYLSEASLYGYVFMGELSLDGSVRSIQGVLPAVMSAVKAGFQSVVVPKDNATEASLVGGVTVFAVTNLTELVLHLKQEKALAPVDKENRCRELRMETVDFGDVHGQKFAKRALEIAAAGAHNVLMVGPPGTGKTMLAQRTATILPVLQDQEALEVTKIYSVAGMLKDNTALMVERPFRSPHHSISEAGLIGGGTFPLPGEVTLSHHGVLFLDELPEFSRHTLELLRQPLEDGKITISRVNASVTYPAQFMLISAMNPCPCGFLGDSKQECVCTPQQIQKYMRKISGPLLDRIDIHIQVPRVEYDELTAKTTGETSAEIRRRVEEARGIQNERFHADAIFCNSQMTHRQVKKYCIMTSDAVSILKEAFIKLGLSARAYDRLLKVALTVADLAHADKITDLHIAEAIQLRTLDRKIQ